MGLVLAIDSAGPLIGAALLDGERLEGCWAARVARGAETRLVPALRELLQGRQPALLALATGPGAFTGLRVGIATGLGLATAWGCPVVPVSSLLARAALAPGLPRVLALLDARKERFYGGLFDTRSELPEPLGDERDLPIEDLCAVGPALAVGEGALAGRDAVLAAGHALHPLADANPAPALARVARHLHRLGRALPPTALRIRYLRPPDARPPAGTATSSTRTGPEE